MSHPCYILFGSLLAFQNCFKLKHLDLSVNDMSQVSSELLVAATQRLERVDYWYSDLTTEQVTALYQMVAERRSGSLKALVIGDNDTSAVPLSLIERAKLNKYVLIF